MIQTIARFFNAGGNFMWVILAVLAVSLAVMIERAVFYFIICRRTGEKILPKAIHALNQGRIEEAKQAVKGSAPLHGLLSVAIERFGLNMSQTEIEEGVEEAAIREMPRMAQRLNYLSLFSNIATLLGLIGTISGLQSSFSSLAAVEASKKAAMLAAGIAEAMNTTAFGLIVAVPCMIMYTLFYNKQAQLTKDLDQSVVRLVNYMKKKRG